MSKRYVSLGVFNLDASNRIKPELNDTEKFYEAIKTTVQHTFEYPTVLTFTEIVNEDWIHFHFEQKTAYWGRSLKVGATKIYTAWNRSLHECEDIVRCQEGRYVAFLLKNRLTEERFWHVSIHGHKKKTDMRRDAMIDLVRFCEEQEELVIVAGDFNEVPERLRDYLPPGYQLGITPDARQNTTIRGSSVDNSFCTREGDYVERRIDTDNDNFSHYPIKFTVAYPSLPETSSSLEL